MDFTSGRVHQTNCLRAWAFFIVTRRQLTRRSCTMSLASSFAKWFRHRKLRPIYNQKGQQKKRFRPILEALEDRITPAANDPFTFLKAGFTQELVTGGPAQVTPPTSALPFAFGIAFAPDGDPIEAFFSGSMWRTDLATSFT